MVATQRSQAVLLPLAFAVALAVAAFGGCTRLHSQGSGAFAAGIATARRAGARTGVGAQQLTPTPKNGRRGFTALGARGGAEEESEAIELGSFAAFVVGLALLPYVVNTLVTAWNVSTGGSFALGPFGLELISGVTTVGITLWSISSFVGRGRGLPAGPLGLLGLSEGLSYIAVIGLIIAAVLSTSRTGGGISLPQISIPSISTPSLPSIPSTPFKVPDFKAPDVKSPGGFKMPDFKAPEAPGFKAPDFKMPEIKAPDFKAPEAKAPSFKLPEFKAPDFKAPDFKAPAIKVPEFKAPDVKIPEFKAPDVKIPEFKVPEVKVPEVKVPEVKEKKATEKKAAAEGKLLGEAMPNYDSLFS